MKFIKTFSQSHNTINRMTQTTGSGMFAPYAKEKFYYFPETELVIFVLIEESVTDIDRVLLGLERIGNWGFGRDASTGLGRFTLGEHDELHLCASGRWGIVRQINAGRRTGDRKGWQVSHRECATRSRSPGHPTDA